MITEELKKTYKSPKSKVIEMNVMAVLCNSQGDGSSSTEQLQEQDVSGDIWQNG